MNELVPTSEVELDELQTRICSVIDGARQTVARSVNVAMVHAYWEIGQIIDEHVTVRSRSESYGSQLFASLAKRLQTDYGPGFERSNLRYMRQFYEAFDIRDGPRHETTAEIVHAPRGESSGRLQISVELSWTHYRLLSKVHQPDARRYYLHEAVASRWSTRELERQILTRHFERGLTVASTPSSELPVFETVSAVSVLRDPYVLEFLGLPDRLVNDEAELEQALIDQLQAFLLELGRGFSFVGRQQRVTIDGKHFHVDLVFYNYVLKCFVLIDLKTGELDHRDIGQMDFYVRYWEAEVRGPDDNPTIGLILCAEKSEAMARYTLLSDHQTIFAAKYLPFLPTEAELQAELQRERHVFEMRQLEA
jgi:predicted nuclease of restriction endonuclease-like (RecB) superfamily